VDRAASHDPRPHRGEPLGLDGKVGAGAPDDRSRRGDR